MIKALVKMYRTVSTKKFATTMEVDRSTILRHLSEFDKVTKMYQWIPHQLIERNMLKRLTCAHHC